MINYPGSLHNHLETSNFRLRDCIVKAEDLIDRAIELGHSVLAITDHETIASSVKVEKLYKKVKEKNIPLKIIMGNEIYLCRDGLNAETYTSDDKYFHFILLAKDREGFRQICEMSTRAWMRSYVSRGRRVPTYYSDLLEIVGKNPGHVIGSTACLGGFLPTQILKYRELERMELATAAAELWQKILNWCNLMVDTFGGKDYFYLELQPSGSKEQTYVNSKLLEISNALDINYIITCDTHYLKEEDRPIHKAYLNASDGDREVDAFYATTYLMDTNQLKNHLDLSDEELEKGFDSILKIQNLCEDYSILKPLVIPTLKWNDYSDIEVTEQWVNKIPCFDKFLKSDYIGDRELVKAVIKGILKHKDLQTEEAYAEINNNLEMTWVSSEVNNAHWSAYYLNLQKIIELCKEAGSIVGPGRGSGVGFILLYCLDITQINPLLEETKTYAWRFLNPDRVSVLDIDFDIEGSKRQQVLAKFREYYGEDRVANVLTLRTEKSKSAILTAARGLGIDNDIADYIATLIPSDRGQIRTLKEVFYGDAEKDFKPVSAFVHEMTYNYPELWEVAQKIEGLICGTGIHAGGVIFVDEPFTNSTALMRAPDGTIITQLDLHNSEAVSLIKYDALSVEAMDKLHICLDLLSDDGVIEKKDTLSEMYEDTIGIYNLERKSPEMWKMVWDHKILSLFQMEQQSGIRGISLAKPQSVEDLAHLNSVIRLMAQEKGGELPLEKYSRFRKDITLWYKEMRDYGLTKEEQDILIPLLKGSYGICESQEQFMMLVQLPECGGYSLNWADKLRKAIAKKNPKGFEELEAEFYDNIIKKDLSYNFCNYVWRVLVSTSKGYGFNLSHTLAYSLVALQEMNLAYKYPILYWDCACLISDSGTADTEIDKATDYGKIAKAISTIVNKGVEVSLLNINTSDYGYKPDVKNNRILYGIKALSNINSEMVEKIKTGRPYTGIKDFMERCPLKKVAMINLIKAGAFDELDGEWAKQICDEPRIAIMIYYINQISEPKKKLNLQNLNGLMQKGLFPSSLAFEEKTYNFNKYLKTNQKFNQYYVLNEPCMTFYSDHFNLDAIEVINGYPCILQTKWDKMYSDTMDTVRNWLKENQETILQQYNTLLFKETWEKYASGNVSSWEMDSLCFYFHDHELKNVNTENYGISDYAELPYEPEIDFFRTRGGKQYPIYKTSKIIGTVISKDDAKSTVTLLTTSSVVNVKFTKDYYAMFSRQISEKQEDGTKKIVEKGWFKRGVKLLVTGYRREDQFIAKSYSHTPTHQIYKIDLTNNGTDMELTHERYTTEEV